MVTHRKTGPKATAPTWTPEMVVVSVCVPHDVLTALATLALAGDVVGVAAGDPWVLPATSKLIWRRTAVWTSAKTSSAGERAAHAGQAKGSSRTLQKPHRLD